MKLETITREYDIDKKSFLTGYFNAKKPVVVNNFIKPGCRALTSWDNAYLKDKAGRLKVNLYGKEDEFNDFVTSPPVSTNVSFGEYLDMISNSPTELRLFLFNLLQKVPSLKQDIIINDITGGKVLKWLPYLFFGGEGSTVRYHYELTCLMSSFRNLKAKRKYGFLHRTNRPYYINYRLTFTGLSTCVILIIEIILVYNTYRA